ncbi:MAG: hypothetical protein GX166_12000 [Clostridiaceae bacterium]|nr:hypothetical protein [Clostridiaceae bacterium]
MKIYDKLLNHYQVFFNKKIKSLRRKRNILLYCASDTMVWHILNYYDQVKEDPGYNFYLYYGDAKTDCETSARMSYEITKDTHIKPITNKKKLVLVPLDLIVTADLDYEPLRYKKDIVPILYVNHGFHIVSIDKERNLYAYGERALDEKGRCKFSCILEANLRIANAMNNIEPFKGLVRHVGAKDGDLIEREIDNYTMYRKKLGIKAEETLVCVFGTWRKESLFQYLGREFLEAMGRMTGKGYKFVLSIHPREYAKYDEDVEPMGPVLEEYAQKYGFIVRHPSDSFIPYLIASDMVISDYTSLYENAILAGKKLCFSYFPQYSVGELSIADSMRNEIKVLRREDIKDLEKQLKEIQDADYSAVLEKYKKEIYPGMGVYKSRVNEITRELVGLK